MYKSCMVFIILVVLVSKALEATDNFIGLTSSYETLRNHSFCAEEAQSNKTRYYSNKSEDSQDFLGLLSLHETEHIRSSILNNYAEIFEFENKQWKVSPGIDLPPREFVETSKGLLFRISLSRQREGIHSHCYLWKKTQESLQEDFKNYCYFVLILEPLG